MAVQEKGVWVTIYGRHVFIKDGETPLEALRLRDKRAPQWDAMLQEYRDTHSGNAPKTDTFTIFAREDKNDIKPDGGSRMADFYDEYIYGNAEFIYATCDSDVPCVFRVVDCSVEDNIVFYIDEHGEVDWFAPDDFLLESEKDEFLKYMNWTEKDLQDYIKKQKI